MSEEIFNFLSSNPEFISDIASDLKCNLCNNVMVNASYLPCGCEYCFKCISNYLDNGNDECPQKCEECESRKMKLEDIKESPTGIKINKLLVKCTNKFCDYQDKVVKVVHHLETCDKIGLNCPLFSFGCKTGGLNEESLKVHMVENQQNHFSMLVGMNNELKTRLDELEGKQIHLDNENKELKERNDELEVRNKEMDKINEENEIMKNQIEELKIRLGNENKEIKEIKTSVINIETELDLVKKENKEIKKEVGMKNLSPFNWMICEVAEKKKSTGILWSLPFYSEVGGYKMEVGIRFDSDGNVGFHGRILRSGNDHKLTWPCTKCIKIKVKNPQTGEVTLSIDIKFYEVAASRPKESRNISRWAGWYYVSCITNATVNDEFILISQIV